LLIILDMPMFFFSSSKLPSCDPRMACTRTTLELHILSWDA
jgi:hypothetical protein